jgi:hypothetical protein
LHMKRKEGPMNFVRITAQWVRWGGLGVHRLQVYNPAKNGGS